MSLYADRAEGPNLWKKSTNFSLEMILFCSERLNIELIKFYRNVQVECLLDSIPMKKFGDGPGLHDV